MVALTKQKKKEFTIIGLIFSAISALHFSADNISFRSFFSEEENECKQMIMCPVNMTISNIIYRNGEIAGWNCVSILEQK